jgi:hypothetical protein
MTPGAAAVISDSSSNGFSVLLTQRDQAGLMYHRGDNSLSTIRKSAVAVGSKTAQKRGEVSGKKAKKMTIIPERSEIEELYL